MLEFVSPALEFVFPTAMDVPAPLVEIMRTQEHVRPTATGISSPLMGVLPMPGHAI